MTFPLADKWAVASSSLDQLCPAQEFPRESRQRALKVVAIVAIALAVPSIALRWVARCQSSSLDWDDYTALAATVLLLGICAIQLIGELHRPA